MVRRNLTALLATAAVAGSLSLGAAAPAQAINSAGDIKLKVTATCGALGDSVKSFTVWTPEKGNKSGSTGSKSSTVDFGQFRKEVTGDTFFNWTLVCKFTGASGSHQKRYGGAWYATDFSYSLEQNLKGITRWP